MNENYAAFAERELVQRQEYARIQCILEATPYDELRRRRDFLYAFNWEANYVAVHSVIPYYNAEIARRHT